MKGSTVISALNDVKPEYIQEVLQSIENKSAFPTKQRTQKLRYVLIAATVVILLAATAIASKYSHSDFFANWFLSQQHNNGTGLDPVEHAETQNVIVADDEDIRIEAIDAMKSGNRFMVGFLVTLKNLETALYDGGYPTMPGYMFETVQFQDLEQVDYASVSYSYSSDYSEIEDNQFLLVIRYDGAEENQADFYIEFWNVVANDVNVKVRQQVYCSKIWTWKCSFEGNESGGKAYHFDDRISFQGKTIKISEIRASMFGCSIHSMLEDGSWTQREIQELFGEVNSFKILLQDGSVVDSIVSGQTRPVSYDGRQACEFVLTATVEEPLWIDQIESIAFLGHVYSLDHGETKP